MAKKGEVARPFAGQPQLRRLAQVQDRLRTIETLRELEGCFDALRYLYWDVLIAIAKGRCEDAAPKDFAAAAIAYELLQIQESTCFSFEELIRSLLKGHSMRLAELEDGIRHIGESFEDAEVIGTQLRFLYWCVLLAIAKERCADVSPQEFAAAAIGAELQLAENFGYHPDYLLQFQERLEGREPAAENEAQQPLEDPGARSRKKQGKRQTRKRR